MAWKVSWALPSGVRRRDKMQNCAASHAAQNQSSDSHLLNWSTNLHQNYVYLRKTLSEHKACKKQNVNCKGPGKQGHVVVDTLLLMMFLGLRKLGNIIVADTKCFWTKSETSFVSRTQNLCPQQMLRTRANGETFVSATMCPRLPGR